MNKLLFAGIVMMVFVFGCWCGADFVKFSHCKTLGADEHRVENGRIICSTVKVTREDVQP